MSTSAMDFTRPLAPSSPTIAPPEAAQRSFSSLARLPPGSLATSYEDVCGQPWPGRNQLPVVYHPSYNISFFGIQKLHPFDSCKFSKVLSSLKRQGVLKEGQTVLPAEASLEVLADVHTQDYLYKIHHHNFTIVQVTELAPLSLLPNKLLQWRVIAPMKLHVGGTILAAGLALERGWAINLGGGMHHASADRGMGWCPFDDIVLAVRRARRAAAAAAAATAAAGQAAGTEKTGTEAAAQAQAAATAAVEMASVAAGRGELVEADGSAGKEERGTGGASMSAAREAASGSSSVGGAAATAAGGSDGGRSCSAGAGATGGAAAGFGRGVVLVIDLDAHQGNGVGRDKLSLPVPDLYILDAYNCLIFPRDDPAKAAIDIAVELPPRTDDSVYLPRLAAALDAAARTLPRPDLVIYNAGTDVLAGDPLGRLGLSAAGVVKRDEMVWRWCRDVARAPVAMLLSGGYTRESAGVISESIENLFRVFGLGDG